MTAASDGPPAEILPPNQTLYLNNLNEKIKKEVLKKSIYSVFSQFGKIVDVVCCRGIRLRGQAWVVFSDVPSATNALRQMQGFPFYDKPMRINFAKTESDVITKAKGTFVPRAKRPRPDQPEQQQAQPPKQLEAADAPPKPKKHATDTNTTPSNVLFAQQLPDECTDAMLAMLFQQYTGFKEVRMVPGKKGIAFVEFADDVQASLALAALNNFKLTPDQTLNLSFAKR
eukprot:CAMPEP_0197387884 /NCGR_PEP_ID=MMETSP1165-20131217/768_1 /TAXON_ID=284809 /ORGANISM="Chrysocystis fragilis, Strain CCMP3189" /LENGTH=227 /DNA_ID=CAMNT_0042913217 /DNA_START=11 /DNA_END=694 /DNA_ORIENTATION=+